MLKPDSENMHMTGHRQVRHSQWEDSKFSFISWTHTHTHTATIANPPTSMCFGLIPEPELIHVNCNSKIEHKILYLTLT